MILHEFLNVTGPVNHREGEWRDGRGEAPGDEQGTSRGTRELEEADAKGTSGGEAHEELYIREQECCTLAEGTDTCMSSARLSGTRGQSDNIQETVTQRKDKVSGISLLCHHGQIPL